MESLLSEAALAELTAELVRIPSVNPAIAPAEGTGEAAVAAFGRDWLVQRGVRAWLEPVAEGRPNLVAETGQGGGATLVLCAHLDTVGTEGMEAPFAPARRGGRLHGRGAYDMKGSAAAVMAALAVLERQALPGRVVAALVADEEHASLGAQAFLAAHRADACILTEPSEGDLVLAHKGFAWFEVTVRGRAAHGSRFDLGRSSIEDAAAFVAAARTFDREVLRRRAAPLVGPASQHVAMISGGAGWSTYAEGCVVRLERRTLPGEDSAAVAREVEALVAASGADATVERVLERPPMVCDRQAPIAVAVREAMRETTGGEPRETGVAYWMDAALFAAAGIPTVDVGPRGGGAHESDEWVDLGSVVDTARILVAAARRFLGAR
jgi:acetylornithine deacetylase